MLVAQQADSKMDPKLEAKLKALKEYWYNDDYSLKWVDAVETKIRQAIVASELSQHKAVVPIIEDARNRISSINKLLVYDEKMDTDTRKLLIREKAVHQFYLDRFDGRDLDKRFDAVGRILDQEMENIGIGKKGK